MKDGAILAGAGHFSWEVDLAGLKEEADSIERLSPDIEQFTMSGGQRLMLLTLVVMEIL
ncbi:hypothetical protein CVD19_21585 [Bacillus sp. T33-2]|nr:hypothetical protein CVD19_21585 [Bacillus sp. T33-2]